MQLEAMQQVGAEPYERSESRKAQRNGYKERSLKTRAGELRLKKPQFREIAFETKVVEDITNLRIPLNASGSVWGIIDHFQENTGEGYGLPTDWRESIKN